MLQSLSFRQRVTLILLLVTSAYGGFWLGRVLFGPPVIAIDTSRVEHCIEAYKRHRQGGHALPLQDFLSQRGITPREFEKTIDRIIHFRISQSSLEQTRRLLDLIRIGSGIRADQVVDGANTGSQSLLLDAAIMTLIQEKPGLIREAFGG